MYKNILVPVVFEDEKNAHASFSVARALASDDTILTLLHVLEEIPDYVSVQIPNEVLAATRSEVERSLSRLAEGLPDAKTQLISGHAGRSIVSYADANNIDCIVLASHKPGFEDILLGSTASRVVRHAKCAVHVVR